MNPFCDKYFTKSRLVAKEAGLNPVVKYRFFMRNNGIAAFEPVKMLAKHLCPVAYVEALPEGTHFSARDTVMTIEAPFQEIVEHETQLLQWLALPSYCALESHLIRKEARGKTILDFHARHLYGAESVALASYGAQVGGLHGFSTDIGANSLNYLKELAQDYSIAIKGQLNYGSGGVGTMPHALLAIFNGNYEDMADAYIKAFPNDKFIALIDYNNREIDDSLVLLKKLGLNLYGVRTDTCGENIAQDWPKIEARSSGLHSADHGVTPSGVEALRRNLDESGGEHVKLFISSGFGVEKTKKFIEEVPLFFDGIGTGSFIPKGPTATSDIMWVNGKKECKKGREWGFEKDQQFSQILNPTVRPFERELL